MIGVMIPWMSSTMVFSVSAVTVFPGPYSACGPRTRSSPPVFTITRRGSRSVTVVSMMTFAVFMMPVVSVVSVVSAVSVSVSVALAIPYTVPSWTPTLLASPFSLPISWILNRSLRLPFP